AYYGERPIAVFLNIPELNQYYKHFNGKLGWLQMLHFVWLKMRGACRHFTGIVFALIPEFQGKGVDAYIIQELANIVQPLGDYDHYEMQWIGDFNVKMVNIARSLGDTHVSRKLTTYRYLFDRTREFKRHPMLA
ncbi:MAG TPA: hypothetical protein VKU83_06105, partial [Puia sp.]|nr:hypothetical protein [Puia sp.]